MGIYIKGLKAPASCCKCRFSRWSNYGQVYMCNVYEEPVAKLLSVYESTKPDWCPLAEVQEPHGDLIDRDALIAQLESDAEQMEEPIAKMFTYAAINDLKHAQIILEAEGSENHEQIQDDH